ncbi:MAG: hypothetical protein ACTSR3_20280, partial [Candidatus Helarchaeota archaeon]
MIKLEKLYDEDFLKDFLFKLVEKLKEKVVEANLGENIISYLEKFLKIRKITQIQLDALINICEAILKREKNNILCFNLEAIAYFYLGDLVQALKSINKSLKINTEEFEANFIMANIL